MKPQPPRPILLFTLLAITSTFQAMAPSDLQARPMDTPTWIPNFSKCDLPAEVTHSPRLIKRQSEFEALCQRDSECYHLKSYRPGSSELSELETGNLSPNIRCSSFKEPSTVLVDHLKRFSDVFESAAHLYEVDEGALLGCILAENTLNYGVDDRIQDWLSNQATDTPADLLTARFSIGLGQIFPSRAAEVEAMAHWIESRPIRSQSEIQTALQSEVGSIFYAAAILRDAWITYARYGIDIRQRPEILCTLYNIGKVDQHAAATRRSNRLPSENFMGFFVRHQRTLIESIRNAPWTCSN